MSSASVARERVAVVGAGVAGLCAALELLHEGVAVDLYSSMPASCAPSASERDGFAACSAGDEEAQAGHLRDTVEAGSHFAHQAPIRAMVEAAPELLDWLLRIGLPIDREPGGALSRTALGGSSRARAVHAGVYTGAQVLRVLDAQLLPFERSAGAVPAGAAALSRFERHELVQLVLDEAGRVVGLVAADRSDGRFSAKPYEAVVLATGSAVGHFGRAAASLASTGSAAAAVFRQGAVWANCDLVEQHPTTVVRGRRRSVVAELLRRRGARLWVPRDPKERRAPESVPERDRDHVLERLCGEPERLAARAEASRALRAIERVQRLEGGAEGPLRAFLDLRGVPERLLRAELGELLPEHRQLAVSPAVTSTLGGVWVDHETDAQGRLVPDSARNQATSLLGLYAAGEVDFQLHGAGRLGENTLLGGLFQGRLAARAVGSYLRALPRLASELPASTFEAATRDAEREQAALCGGPDTATGEGEVDPLALCDELRACVDQAVDAEGAAGVLRACSEQVDAIAEKARGGLRAREGAFAARQARELSGLILHARAYLSATEARRLLELDGDGQPLPDRSPTILFVRPGAQPGSVEVDRSFELVRPSGTRRIDGAIDARSVATPRGQGALAPTSRPLDSSPPASTGIDVDAAIARAESKGLRFRVRVRRSGPASQAPRRDEFVLEWEPGQSVHDCLERIEREPRSSSGERVLPPAWDASCAEGRCGACTMRINGRARRACVASVDGLLLERGEAVIDLEPLSKFPVVRDLAVDRSGAREKLRRVKAWVELGGSAAEARSPRVGSAPADALGSAASPCIACGACLEACPEVHPRSDFVGAAAIHEARLAIDAMGDTEPARRRLEALIGPGGVADCGKSNNCVEACPMSLPLDESIHAMARATTLHFAARLRRRG